ncbi:DNA internalization-related competence protein ComEC/Rec2 [Flavobacterium sp. W21_SRS_FM6]|uniref:DNA internalization-related competence protein ComEC/Rec2 n=1 Tax=Flavobacterium sp. W21_SRS_FM6 TaxID=3240268 RepID=UPI003F90D809
MDSKLFIFISASITSLYWTNLPSVSVTLSMFCLAACGLVFNKTRTYAFALIGISWMASVGHWQYSLQLPLTQIRQAVWVEGRVLSINHQVVNPRFNLSIDKIAENSLLIPRVVRLSWNNAPWHIQQGQHVYLLVKLKPPHGLANEAGFNYQQWLFSENISATGYVKNDSGNTLLLAETSLRQRALNQLIALNLKHEAWIAALTLGYRGLLETDDWSLVQSTGIAHLIAISGLHLALVASMSYFILAWGLGLIVSRFYQLHGINLHKVALVGTVLTTYAYSALAGFGLPTLRAWLSLLLLACIFLGNLNLSLRRVVLLSISGFVFLFPLSLFGLSFWLSFSAVLIILFIFWCRPHQSQGFNVVSSLKVMIKIQLALSVLMLPIIAWQFAYISWLSPVINLLAVPLVTLVLVPLCLLAIIFLALWPPFAHVIFNWVDALLSVALHYLQQTQSLSWAVWSLPAIPMSVWLLFLTAIVCFMLPNIGKIKGFCLVLFLPILSYAFTSHNTDWQIDILDVGHGSAVVISKQGRAVMYDVGAAYPSGFNMAESVILPLLKARGIAQLDKVIISHWDNDHSGSLQVLKNKISVAHILTTDTTCRLGQVMQWQGLSFTVLWPDNPTLHNDNNSSCVIHLSDGQHSILLAGDIDASIEKRLVEKWGDKLKSDILLAPHHGSNTSSSAPFIHYVSPQYVVFTQGFMNRWSFPRPEVLRRYNDSSATLFSSSEVGQVSFIVPYKHKEPIVVRTYRQDIYPFWYANFPKALTEP